MPTAGHDGHAELAQIWRDVGADDTVHCAVLRGEGLGFSGGGDLALVQQMADDFEVRTRVWKEARDLVYNVINCDKPIVSAIHGPAVGAGLALGSQSAIRWTGPAFDASLALEFMGFAGPDVKEGVASLRERRPPRFT